MVTNLPPDAKSKWNEVTQTRNPETRLKLMGEFLSMVPKHKGTDKLQAELKQKISKAKKDSEQQKTAKKKVIRKKTAARKKTTKKSSPKNASQAQVALES